MSDTLEPLLADLLQDVPFGLSVTADCGTVVYANAFDRALTKSGAAPTGRTIETTSFPTDCSGQNYEARLSLDVTAQRRLEDELFQAAFVDDLTKLPNRRLAERAIGNEIESGAGRVFALALIDLDGFEDINAYYGDEIGDRLLAAASERLSSTLRQTDMLARIGGNKFILMLTPVGDMDLAGHVESILNRLKEPFVINTMEIFLSASIGISLYPKDGVTCEILSLGAESAARWVKAGKKGRAAFFDPEAEGPNRAKIRFEQQLRLALRDGRLCCAYQPKVNFRSGALAGVEVLLRWRDEDGAVRSPGNLLDVASERGLMEEITRFVLLDTIDSIAVIDQAFGASATISINVPADQAGQPEFMRGFIEALQATGQAGRFMLEITEETILAKGAFQEHVLPAIREAGMRISIDDFGVGYSSIATLADITADELKIDRSFVTDIDKKPRSQSILKCIATLGQVLGMTVVVEGVETPEELAYLRDATGINVAQGYYFSRPVLMPERHNPAISTPRTPNPPRIAPMVRPLRRRA